MMRGTNRGRFGAPAARPPDDPYGYEYGSFWQPSNTSTPSFGHPGPSSGYVRTRLPPSAPRPVEPYSFYPGGVSQRSGPYADSGLDAGGRDLLRSGPGGSFFGGYSNGEPGRDLVGFPRGRGAPSYAPRPPGRNLEVMARPSLRGQGLLLAPPPRTPFDHGAQSGGFAPTAQFARPRLPYGIPYRHAPQTFKRKTEPDGGLCIVLKKAKPEGSSSQVQMQSAAVLGEEESAEEKQKRVRREKQRRRREKDMVKFGESRRLAYVCSFCRVRTSDDAEMAEHFASDYHKETLAHIRSKTNFCEKTMQFLHDSMVFKFRKNVQRRQNCTGPDVPPEEDVSSAMKVDPCLTKVEMILCTACNSHFPSCVSSVQMHVASSEHQKKKSEFNEMKKRECVLTATSIMSNPCVKIRFEKYQQGENPFEDDERQDVGEEEEKPGTGGEAKGEMAREGLE